MEEKAGSSKEASPLGEEKIGAIKFLSVLESQPVFLPAMKQGFDLCGGLSSRQNLHHPNWYKDNPELHL